MPRGGRRPGAGRKPGGGVVLGMDGNRRQVDPSAAALPPAPSAEVRAGLAQPPDDLPAAAKPFWLLWAPRAIEERTLVPATEAGFRTLCVRMATVEMLEDRVQVLGIGTIDSLPCMKE